MQFWLIISLLFICNTWRLKLCMCLVHFSRVLQVIHEFSLFKYIYICVLYCKCTGMTVNDMVFWHKLLLVLILSPRQTNSLPSRKVAPADLVSLGIYITPATKMTKRFRSEVAWTTLLKMCLVSSSHKSFFLPLIPSFIYSWSISHILEHKFFCLGHLGSSHCKYL